MQFITNKAITSAGCNAACIAQYSPLFIEDVMLESLLFTNSMLTSNWHVLNIDWKHYTPNGIECRFAMKLD